MFLCPLYPGLTCQQHCDAAVDVDAPRDDFLVKVPFLTLCPNSWLVPPTGEPIPIEEEDQFVAAKVQKAVDTLQKELGAPLSVDTYGEVRNALTSFDTNADNENFAAALRALAGVETLVKKPHKSLQALVATRLGDLDDPIRWAFEDASEPGAKDDTPLAERVAAVRALVKAVEQPVYGQTVPVLKAMQAWVKAQTGK